MATQSNAGYSSNGRSQNVADDILRLKIKMLQAKLNQERESLKSESTNRADRSDVDDELEKAKRKQQELLTMLRSRPPPPPQQYVPPPPLQPKPKVAQKKGESSTFEKYMEMMLIQQTQSQNMIMNRLLIGTGPQGAVGLGGAYGGYGHHHGHGHHSCHACHSPSCCSSCSSEEEEEEVPIKLATPEPVPMTPITPDLDPYEFPGNAAQRRIRQIGYAALFCKLLDKEGKRQKFRPSETFRFDLTVKEVTTACHRLYLQDEGKIFPLLQTALISEDAYEFLLLADKKPKAEKAIIDQTTQDLNFLVENLTFYITEIMPPSGILGTHKKAGVYDMIKNGQKFPSNYFYAMEKELIVVDTDTRTTRIDDLEAAFLILQVFFMKALVTTVLLKPVLYGVAGQDHSQKTADNIRVVASIYTHIHRLILRDYLTQLEGKVKNQRPLHPVPIELATFVYPDDFMAPLYKRIDKSITYSKDIIVKWAEEYVSRLRSATF